MAKNTSLNGRYGLGFHGSAQSIKAFTDRQVGMGGDANSALGLFMSHVPMNALEYALNANELGEGPEVLVYVIQFPASGQTHQLTPDEYYGMDETGNPGKPEHFRALRQSLLSQGYDCIECDTGEDAVSIALTPSKCRIIAVLDQHQVEALDAKGIDCFDPDALYDALSEHLVTQKHSNNLEEEPCP